MFEAIILAGGFGTRLREVVPDVPKPMAPIAGRPFLAWQLDYLIKSGVTRFILSLGYRADVIRAYFGSQYGGAEIVYVVETEPLGTGGALRLALASATAERVFAFNGDTLCEADLQILRNSTAIDEESVGILVKHVQDAARYGALTFNEANLVTHFGEKLLPGPGYINAGIYDLPRNLFCSMHDAASFSFETSVLQSLVGTKLYAAPAGQFFIDIGVKEDFLRAQTAIPAFISSHKK